MSKFLITTTRHAFIKDYYNTHKITNLLSRKLGTASSTNDVFSIILDIFDKEINFEDIIIYSAQKENNKILNYSFFKSILKPKINPDISLAHNLIKLIDSKKNILLIKNILNSCDAKFAKILPEKLFKNGIIVPLFSSDTLEGFLFLSLKSSGSDFSEKDFEFFHTLINIITPVFDRIRPFEKLEAEFNENKKKLFDSQLALEKEKQSQLEKAKQMAEMANEFKSKFLAQMTHDLRTPLHVVIGTLDLLSRNLQNLSKEDAAKTIDMALKSGERQLDLVNDILDLSKIESGKMEVNIQPLFLADFLKDIEPQVTMLLRDKPVKYILENNLPENTVIESDSRRLMQVIINLLSNAVKFTKKGQIRLSVSKIPLSRLLTGEGLRSRGEGSLVSTKGIELGFRSEGSLVLSNTEKVDIDRNSSLTLPQGEEILTFTISDTGIGMTEENAKKIFEPYIMVDNEAQKSVKGTGLGLSICKGFVEALGGEISVISVPKKGSIFRFWIPFIQAEITAKEMQKQKETTIDYSALKDKYILMCDDDVFNRMFAEMVLKGKIKYTIVDNGYKAIEETKKQKFDLIFMDIQMPEIDGIETMKEIRKQKITTPIIALTAQAMKGEKERLISFGFDDYFQKPFKEQAIFYYIMRKLL
ncbi:hybrid sensor histidine kinase/response regulator [Candidatus Margulisiibacteriota bacterium]